MEGKKNIRNFLIEEIASLANYSLLDSVVVSGGNPRVLELFLDNPFFYRRSGNIRVRKRTRKGKNRI